MMAESLLRGAKGYGTISAGCTDAGDAAYLAANKFEVCKGCFAKSQSV